MDNKNIIERILKATGSKTQRELAKVLEVPEQSITDYKKKSGVPATWLIKLCASHKINPNWIQTGVGPMYVEGKAERGHEVLENQEEYSCPSKGGKVEEDENGELTVPVLAKPSVDEYNYVPMVEAQLSAGGGSFMASERIKDYYAFRKPFIANVATSPKKLILMRVTGDSMDPEIRNGATVMIDLGRKHIKNNCIFALGIEDTIIIKELERLPGGRVRVISKNRTEYPPYEADVADLHIIGQVVWGDRLYPI